MNGGRVLGGVSAAALVAVAMAGGGGETALAKQVIGNNTPIQSVVVAPATATAEVGQQRFFNASAILTDPMSSTRILGGGGGAFYSVTFAPSLAVAVCGASGGAWGSQSLPVDQAGVFHEVWSPGQPNTLKVDGAMTNPQSTAGASLSGTLACVNGAANGSLAAFWNTTHYEGTYSFNGGNGDVWVTGVTWSSSDPSVATVNRGMVTALSPGQTVITATYGSLCWQTLPGAVQCLGTISGSATLEVTPPSGGGGGGGNEGPFLTAGEDRTLECSAQGTSPVTLEGAIFFEPEVPLTYTWVGPFGTAFGLTPTVGLPLGANELTFTISDGSRSASDDVVITMQDTVGPTIAAVSASPSVIWPPNHKMVPVTLSVTAVDVCSPSLECHVVEVTSSDGGSADYEVTGPLTVKLRAERAGNSGGRTYTAVVECTDASGNSSRKSVAVVVPHNR